MKIQALIHISHGNLLRLPADFTIERPLRRQSGDGRARLDTYKAWFLFREIRRLLNRGPSWRQRSRPQPVNQAGGGQHRHLAREHQGRLLEQEREPAALARPGHLDPLHAVLGASRARHLGGDGAMVLGEVQMPPGKLGEIMGLARPGAVGAGKQGAVFGGEFDGRLAMSSR